MNPRIQELLGQAPILSQLVEQAVAERLHHCLIFEGPPQVGKATAAGLLAQASACLASPELRPCGACPNCGQIRAGTHPDVLRLTPDPKRKTRTIGVDQVRELIRQVRLRRYSARWRTIIVDPADGLMPQAANALLKTLEEPPPGTGFILVTSRVSGLLPTVRSRAQRVRFRAVSEPELSGFLRARGVKDAERLARLSMGCPGRALALAEGGLRKADEAREQLLAALEGGSAGVFAYAEALTRKGDSREAVDAALDALEGLLRDAVVVGAGRPERALNPGDPARAQRWAQALWPTGVDRLQRRVDEARVRVGLNVNGRLLVESLLAHVALELGAAPAETPRRSP